MATRLLFFGALREIAGGAERMVKLPPRITTAHDLIDWLGGDNAALMAALSAPSTRIAIDLAIVDRTARFETPKEIAFMPPFSGG